MVYVAIYRCLEFRALVQQPELLVNVLPADASLEDIEVDPSLSFLDNFVQGALNNGAIPYTPPAYDDDDDDDDGGNGGGLKVTPYAMPSMPVATVSAGSTQGSLANNSLPTGPSGIVLGGSGGGGANIEGVTTSSGANLTTMHNPVVQLKVATTGNVWGKKEPVPEPEPTAPAPATPSGDLFGGVNISSPAVPVPSSNTMPTVASTPSVATPAPPPEPEKPREPTEKEKMAAKMFMGMGGGGSSGSTKRGSVGGGIKRSNSPVPPRSSSPVPPAAPAASMDLLGGMPASNPPPSASPASGGMFAGMEVAASNPPPAPTPPASGGMFAGMDVAASNPPPAPTPPKPAEPSTLDIFADMSAAPEFQAPQISNIMSQFDSQTPPPPLAAAPPVPVVSANVGPDISPCAMTTAEFGGKWGGLPHELKNSIACGQHIRTLDMLKATMTNNTSASASSSEDIFAVSSNMTAYHHIESIAPTTEAIYGATNSRNDTILVHIKLIAARNKCDIIVKGNNREVCNTVMGELCSNTRLLK